MGLEKKRKKKQIKRKEMRGEPQEQKHKTGFKVVLKRFIKLNKSFIPAFCFVIFLIIISKALTAMINIIIGTFFDYILNGNYSVFYKGIIVLCMIQLIKSIIQYQINYRANYTSEECIRNMRNYTYTHVTKASMRWLDSNKLGDIISRVNGDLNIFVEVVYKFLTYQVSNIIDFIVSVIACFIVSWKLAIVSFALIPLIGGLQMLIGKPIAKWGEKRATAEGKANAIFIDLLNGITILKAFGIDKEMYRKHEKEVNNAVNASIKSYTIEFLLLPLQFIMSFAPMILLLSVGCISVIRKEISFGVLLSFIMLSNNAINIISGLSYQVREIYNTIGIANRIFEIWDVELEDKGGSQNEKTNEIPIQFDDVKFFYREGIPILDGINFTVKKGEKIALVGESGAGKSTIIKLLAGFYEKTEGNIYVFGNKIEEWNKPDLRRYMSYVGQDSYLFPGSILSNVLLAREGATEGEARKVIEEVGLGSLDVTADIGEGGINLSGGQRQRVCIARVLLKNSDIILLDEPTSALDTESESCVNAAFEKLSKDKTCIIIAHRLSAIHNVERIICLRNGKIVEEGSHDELMKLGGVYFELYQKQDREVLQYET